MAWFRRGKSSARLQAVADSLLRGLGEAGGEQALQVGSWGTPSDIPSCGLLMLPCTGSDLVGGVGGVRADGGGGG